MCTLKLEVISGKSCKSTEKCFLFHLKMIDPESYPEACQTSKMEKIVFPIFIYLTRRSP